MSRRLDIELTSERPDGTWTWRAAGAKQPKGELSATLLPSGAKVGDVVRADADFQIEGIEILSILPPKAGRREPERLEVVGTRSEEPLVTTQLAPKGRSREGDRKGRRRDRGDRPDRGPRDDRRDAPGGRGRSEGRSRGPRPDPVPERPKPKRLRPGRQHRSAVLDELPVEHRPIAEQVLRGGVPAVREAINKQNEQARAENRPEVPADQLVVLAEQLLPLLRSAEWMDRAQAALADLEELDLRDLRSVVVAADGGARGEEAQTLRNQLQEGLTRRVEQEQQLWVDDIAANLDAGRFVRALRLSSRSPKAGAPLPPELATRLIVSVSEGLTPTVNQDLWAAAVDALAFSPIRNQVTPVGRPAEPSEALLDAVKRVGDRLPAIVELFGLDPAEVAKAAKRRGRSGRAKPKSPRSGDKAGKPEKAPKPGTKSDGTDTSEEAEPTDGADTSPKPVESAEGPVDESAPAGVSGPEESTLPTGTEVPVNEKVEVAVEPAVEGAPDVVVVPAEAERVIVAELVGEPEAPLAPAAAAPDADEEAAPAAEANADAVESFVEGTGEYGGDTERVGHVAGGDPRVGGADEGSEAGDSSEVEVE